MTREEALDWLRTMRGVEDPCPRCQGMGRRSYGSTATWRGGIGGQSITDDVCDVCWGTGDKFRRGVDLRRMMREEESRVAERAGTLLAEQCGTYLSNMRPALREVAAELARLGRGRKERPQFFYNACAILSRRLVEACDASEAKETTTPEGPDTGKESST